MQPQPHVTFPLPLKAPKERAASARKSATGQGKKKKQATLENATLGHTQHPSTTFIQIDHHHHHIPLSLFVSRLHSFLTGDISIN